MKLRDLISELMWFGAKQSRACLYGGLLLAAMIGTHGFYPTDPLIARYDALLIFAVLVQIAFLTTGLEHPREAIVILMFHLVGTVMELFKTSVGSWTYPEENLLRIGGVPLFSGFMYSAVGSYLARVVRVFDFRWQDYPRRRWTIVLGAAIYLNFFTHHWVMDLRLALFVLTVVLFLRTWVDFKVARYRFRMPLVVGFALVTLFIWLAENIGTWSHIWLYPHQQRGWRAVSVEKYGSWYLLMILSWVMVTMVHRPRPTSSAEPESVGWARSRPSSALTPISRATGQA